jgi:hypothetical protein
MSSQDPTAQNPSADRPLFHAGSLHRQFAHEIVRRLVDRGYVAYYAGGCVRDALLSLTPKDFDVATDATPEQVREVFGADHTRAVGEAFGVVLVHGRLAKTKCQVEVATFRTDGSYSDGRRPDWVVYATAEQDAQRRDFTINGLFYDPIAQRVIDFVGGQIDLGNRLLRAIGDPYARINEDKLRMLRAIRFAARFALELDPATRKAIEESASGIQRVSGERIGPRTPQPTMGLVRTRTMQSACAHRPRTPAGRSSRTVPPTTRYAPRTPRRSGCIGPSTGQTTTSERPGISNPHPSLANCPRGNPAPMEAPQRDDRFGLRLR